MIEEFWRFDLLFRQKYYLCALVRLRSLLLVNSNISKENQKMCYRTCFEIWIEIRKAVSLQCYPENNLFTLRELIPIEDLKNEAL